MLENANIAELIASNEALRLEVLSLKSQVEKLLLENLELRSRLKSNSKNSSRPPSTDGYEKPKPKPKSQRKRSGNKPGKQPGAKGKHLSPVLEPDETINHIPDHCNGCGKELDDARIVGEVRRQVFDLPPVSAIVTEHCAQRRRCSCGIETLATFPKDATGPTCYGPNIRALVCYLVVRQHIPIKRVAELVRDSYSIPISTGTIVAMVKEGAKMLDDFLASLRDQLIGSEVVHADETGMRVDASLYWVHSASTNLFTLYHLDQYRGTKAMDAMGVLEHLSGVLVHDGWSPYRKYIQVEHALCNAHHLRELTGVVELQGQLWASDMMKLLSDTWHRVLDLKEAGITSFSPEELSSIKDAYDKIIIAGRLENPEPPQSPRRGRTKKTKAANLLQRLDVYANDVLRFTTDFHVSFDNNEAERQVRMIKLQQKISGGFRTVEGAKAWLAIRSYVATVIKNGENPLRALEHLMAFDPWMPPALNTG